MTQLFCLIAHVSKDGRDLAILASRDRLLLVRDFERVCRGEISLANAGQVLRLLPGDRCFYLAFGHGRVCVAMVRFSAHVTTLLLPTDGLPFFLCFPFSLSQLRGLYIVNLGRDPSIYSAKVVFVRPHLTSASGRHQPISCMQLTDRRIYFRGRTRDVGTSRCSKTEKIDLRPRQPGPSPQQDHLLKYGHGWTPNLVVIYLH